MNNTQVLQLVLKKFNDQLNPNQVFLRQQTVFNASNSQIDTQTALIFTTELKFRNKIIFYENRLNFSLVTFVRPEVSHGIFNITPKPSNLVSVFVGGCEAIVALVMIVYLDRKHEFHIF